MEHTTDHVDCPACEAAKHAAMFGANLGNLHFSEAADQWLKGRHGLADRTRSNYLDYFKALDNFFGRMKLREIHIGHISMYQAQRQEAIRGNATHQGHRRGQPDKRESDGAQRINHEISALGQVLRRAGLWEAIKKFYEPLPLPKEGPGIALTTEEEDHLMKVARSRPRWRIAYCCALISRGTTAAPGEIFNLRLQDVELDGIKGSYIHVHEGAKNEFRKRPLKLVGDAEAAVRWLMARAIEMGAVEPQHYLIPHRAHNRTSKPDPTRPAGGCKSAHGAIRREAAKKFPRLAKLRMYDFRHTAATDMLENPAISYSTIEHQMGHRINSNTKRHYDHLRDEALSAVSVALDRGHTKAVMVKDDDPLDYKGKPARSDYANVLSFPGARR